MAKLTVYDFLRLKGKRQVTQTFTMKPDEAAAFEAAGLDVVVTMAGNLRTIRAAAPNVFLIGGIDHNQAAESDADAIRLGHEALAAGADAVYCGTHDLDRIAAMSAAAIPVIGHVGLVPYRDTWFGGRRAIGKTLDEAVAVYERTMDYEAAGAIAVEMEVVPDAIAAEISQRTDMMVISMGAGGGCDGQYLFAEDILGTHDGHYPRHAKKYRDLLVEYERIRKEMEAAFAEFKADVESGAYPEKGHAVGADPQVVSAFRDAIAPPSA